ncbi:hypothetical protein [Hymenobacter sp. 5516J-16]|nr:hypothetical protein [Hymenobacter sp. 5516J-16]
MRLASAGSDALTITTRAEVLKHPLLPALTAAARWAGHAEA